MPQRILGGIFYDEEKATHLSFVIASISSSPQFRISEARSDLSQVLVVGIDCFVPRNDDWEPRNDDWEESNND